MEPRFGQDFGRVRVHTDGTAASSADAIAARAFTHGEHIAFARGEYEPTSTKGRELLAHELSHVVQQASGAARIQRATYKVGGAAISVDYGDVVMHDAPAQHQSQIESRYTALTGRPAADITARVTAMGNAHRRWLVFALDLLKDNPAAGLDLTVAAVRLVDHAPSAIELQPLARGPEFAAEAMRVSGWLEVALTAGLVRPNAVDQAALDQEYNPTAGAGGASSSACPVVRPPGNALDEATLRADLDPLLRSYVAGQATAARAKVVSTHDVTEIRPVADVVQAEALRFFAPYIGHSHTRSFQQTWVYSAHLTPSTAPGAIPAEVARAFLDNRARGKGAAVLSKVHFDPRCAADELVFADIVDKVAADASVQTDLAAILSWQTFTGSSDAGAEVTVNLQHGSAAGSCDARWTAVETLCHELMHVYVSQEFADLSHGRQLISEGFPEILGDQLYEDIRQRADGDATFRRRFEGGLPAAACGGKVRAPKRLYGDAAEAAERIRGTVGDRRFRAAFFLGRTQLAGLQPQLRVGRSDDPLERQADTASKQALAGGAVSAVGRAHGGPQVQRQPAVRRTPQDRADVQRAKARLAVLEPALANLQGEQLSIEAERLRVLADRKALDARSDDPVAALKEQGEEANWTKLNVAPLTVTVSPQAVTVRARFHVRFEDPAMAGRFGDLRKGLTAGVDMVWKQQLGGVFAGRTFTVVPELTLIGATTARNHDFWLITVRKASTGLAVTYPGCALPNPDPQFATSVTDPMCDGGVMSIPPAHLTNAGVLGHELLHLFGLLDRYVMFTDIPKTGAPTFTLQQLRNTPGRRDPLGGQDATILREDLGYLFDKLGVYRRESGGRDAAVQLMDREVRRFKRIVELGYDPDSLVRDLAPKDFVDKTMKTAEDL